MCSSVHTKEVIAKVEQLHRSLVEGYSGICSASFSGDPTIAERYRQELERAPRQIEELGILTSDQDRQRGGLAVLGRTSPITADI